MMDKSPDLLPCPFCGGQAKAERKNNHLLVICTKCGMGEKVCIGGIEGSDSHEKLDNLLSSMREAWNTRVNPKEIPVKPVVNCYMAECPVCGEGFADDFEYNVYCRGCGQKLDWSACDE